jgi:hypothetical protein
VSWQAVKVNSIQGDEIAARLLEIANDPATWTLANFGAAVTRVKSATGEVFYFSPHAASLCAAVVASHGGSECTPPLSRSFPSSRSSRLLFGFRNRWEPFQPVQRTGPHLPPRIVAGKA